MATPNQYCLDTTIPPGQNVPLYIKQRFYRLWAVDYEDKHLWPIDWPEKDRMDIIHKVITDLRHGCLYSPHIKLEPRPASSFPGSTDTLPTPTSFSSRKPVQSSTGPNILDLGTGTGIWAIDMSKLLPTASVLGLDYFWFMQPAQTGPKCHFWTQDVEQPWDGVEYNWDLINIRMMMGHIRDWQGLYNKVFDYLRPGTGWMEHVEIDFTFRTPEGIDNPNVGVLREWEAKYRRALARYGRKAYCIPTEIEAFIHQAGFVDIRFEAIDVPLTPQDLNGEDIGRSANLAITRGLQAMSLWPMTADGMTMEEVNELVCRVGDELCRLRGRTYMKLFIWSARKPDGTVTPVSPTK